EAPSALKSVPALRSSGCNVGVIMGYVHRNRRRQPLYFEDYAERILALIDEQPDRTLDELLAAMHRRRMPGSRSALWRFLDRHDTTQKKSSRSAEQHRADVARATRPRSRPTWSASGAVARVASD